MIYLNNTTSAQSVFIPKELKGEGTLTINIVSTIDREEYVNGQAVIDLNTSALYYIIALTLPEGIPDGEYEYRLKDGSGRDVATGVLKIGEQDTSVYESFNSEVKYEQYESE